MLPKLKGYRGSILHFIHSPKSRDDTSCYQYWSDGLLVVADARILQVGAYQEIKAKLPENTEIIDYSGFLLMPGFIDTHIHYPQTGVIASYGDQLLEWLNEYVFPEEKKFADEKYAANIAQFFLQELLRNGTTTCVAYSTVHAISAEVLFAAAKAINMCMLTGKTLMDRNAPEYLTDTADTAYLESKQLIAKWHNLGRAKYVVTPRFAPTSTEAQLEVCRQLLQEFSDVYLQTHISENCHEVKWATELFPWCKNYTDIYEHYNLLTSRSLFGHAIHISAQEFQRFAATDSVLVWCPTSNFFLGSGLFKLDKAREFNNRLALATDVGGGSSFSMLQTLNEAYKVAALQGIKLSPLESFYRITLGNAEAISLESELGNFCQDKYADFVVIDPNCTPLLASKNMRAKSLEDVLFNLSILGDDRAILATYVAGCLRHQQADKQL